MTDESRPASDEPATPQTSGDGLVAKRSTGDGRASEKWAWLGKAGVVVAAIVGVLSIYNHVFPRGPSLTAYCTSASVGAYLKHGYDSAVKNLTELEERKARRATEKRPEEKKPRKEKPGKDTPNEPQLGYEIELGSLKGFFKGFGWEFPFSEPIHALTCRIVNEGTEPANDVTLYLPSRPVRLLVNEKVETLPEGNTVSLKNVPAGPPTNVEVWLKGFIVSDIREDRLFINYQGGKGKVMVGKTHFGLWHAIKENLVWNILLLILALAMVMQIVIWVKGDR